jgi:hypothetical protein
VISPPSDGAGEGANVGEGVVVGVAAAVGTGAMACCPEQARGTIARASAAFKSAAMT